MPWQWAEAAALLLAVAVLAIPLALAWWLLDRPRAGRPRRPCAADAAGPFGPLFCAMMTTRCPNPNAPTPTP
ncbi:hypothetical protein QE399_002845 [Paracidovorax wautersii]|uniref:Uncharacterized protein n=1 Tax=Paracidovorax wautersii TaxID=1177982 RepID=A0ABU1ID51_9BURK|nr:hypothetical protein [Paracidovorax wautersii]